MSEKYFKLDYEVTRGIDLVAFRKELDLSQVQMALFQCFTVNLHQKIEASDEVIATLLNADQRHTKSVVECRRHELMAGLFKYFV